MMRVTFFSVSDRLGGSEMALLEILRTLRAAQPRWSFEVIVPGSGPLKERVEALGASAVVLPFPAAVARLGESGASASGGAMLAFVFRLLLVALTLGRYERSLKAALRRSRPDVLHTNGLKAHVLGARAAPAGTKVVWHLHEYIGRRLVTRGLLARYARRCAVAIANSRSVADDVRRAIGPRLAVEVVHNAVNREVFGVSGPAADLDALSCLSPAPAGTVKVGLVAAFGKWKGHDVFLRALAAIPEDVPVRGYVIGGALYDTAGSQHTERNLRALAASLGLGGRVGFTGFVEAAPAMRALDVVVHASTEPEPFGLVIAEAMSVGRPVITSAIGGASEIVELESDALLHRAGDPESLARAITRLGGDAALRQAMGDRAARAATSRFDSGRMARLLSQIYEGTSPATIEAFAG